MVNPLNRNLISFLSCLMVLLPVTAFATHNRAGEIIYEQIGNLRVRATIITYTKASSVDADRDSLQMEWGDGTRQFVVRSNGGGEGVFIGNDTKYNLYVSEHTYPSISQFTMSVTDPNRNAGILNVNPPNSENIPFHIETTFTLLNPQFQGYNSSPILLQPPIDVGCVGQIFIHNPNAFDDHDQDSIAYELIVPKQFVQSDVPNYLYPNQVAPGPNNNIGLNPVTGDFVWNSPQLAGEYNIAILIKEYRQGILINSMIRDMQILILDNCKNTPPEISSLRDTCIIAGQPLRLTVIATDNDMPAQKIKLTALGGPLVLATQPATFTAPSGYADAPVIGIFDWTPSCDAVNSQYYSVIFKAVDNKFSQNDTLSGLSDLQTLRIKVIAPAPENLKAVAGSDHIRLTWDAPYSCENTSNRFFRGFNIWRKVNSSSFKVDTCNPSLQGQGYTRIAYSIQDKDAMGYFYKDNNIEKGKSYCYRVEAIFARTTSGGFPYNQVSSLASMEACARQEIDICLITNVSVVNTAQNGSMFIQWALPQPTTFDTVSFPGPYTYILKRSPGIGNNSFTEIPGARFMSVHFLDAVTTSFVDTFLNTKVMPYEYLIELHYGSPLQMHSKSTSASSVFLTTVGIDEKVILTWEEFVPFSNYNYAIFRKNTTGQFDSIGVTTARKYIDSDRSNGETYCYKVKSFGTYNLSYIPEPLINWSQDVCAIPIDSMPPCAPHLQVVNDCGKVNIIGNLSNHLLWTNPDSICGTQGDVRGYIIYYRENKSADREEITRITDPQVLSYDHFSVEFGLAGCYEIVAFDSIGNVSEPSNIVCMENCPVYKLPNAFTPNGDGSNDIFKPYPYQFISKVDFKVFNRWGNQLFSTNDPNINWTGSDNNGSQVPDGTYYYTCNVYSFGPGNTGELLIETLSGYIEIIR